MFDLAYFERYRQCPFCEVVMRASNFKTFTRLDAAWADACPDCAKAESRRRARARNTEMARFKRSPAWQTCLTYFNHTCAVCGRAAGDGYRIVADHWIPLVHGGQADASNIVPLCHGYGGCNSKKNSFDAAIWLARTYAPGEAAQILARIEVYFSWVRGG